MNRILVGIVVLVTIGLAGIAAANKAVDSGEPAMMVSPSTIVLEKVDTITVHTNIRFSTVVPGSIELNGVEADAVFADNCGDLVAKFAVEDLLEAQQLVPDGENELTLEGDWKAGGSFRATDLVRVK
jgi:hypothetical protein